MPASRVYDMDFDEISTVDIPANQHGLFVLAKRANPEEIHMPDAPEFDLSEFKVGDVVEDEDGNQFVVANEDDGDLDYYDGADTREMAEVGKSAFFSELTKREDAVFSMLAGELSKAASDEDREQVLAKAFAVQSSEIAELRKNASDAMEIAKAAEDRENTARYISKAAEYNLPISPDELGPVMKRAAEALSYEDCEVLHKAFSTSSDIFTEVGFGGEADMNDPLAAIEGYANGELQKDANGVVISKEAAVVDYFNQNPGAYNALRNQG